MLTFNTNEQTQDTISKVAGATTNTNANYWRFTESPKTFTYTRTSATPASTSKFTFYTHSSDGSVGVKLPPSFTIGNIVSLRANFTVVNTIPGDTQNTDAVGIFFNIYTKPKKDGTDRASWYNSRLAITPQINSDNNGHRIVSDVSYTITSDHFGAAGTALSSSFSGSDLVNFILLSSNSVESLINWKFSLNNVFVEHNITAPTVIQISPTFGTTNTLLNITGLNLANTSSVKIKDVNASFTLNSSSSIYASVVASSGNASVVLTDASGTNASFEGSFIYRNPSITSLSPSSGTNNTIVRITGENLSNTSFVQIGGINLSYVVNSSVSVSTRAPNLSNGSTTVTAIDNLGNSVSYSGFTYANPRAISMNTSGAPRSNIVIEGENLANTSVVQFNNLSTTFTAFPNYINVSVPFAVGNTSVSVTDNVGNRTIVPGNFLYKTPVLTGMVPETSRVEENVTLYGMNLANTSYISFGNARSTTFTASTNIINVSVPINNGNVSVTVTDIYGNDTPFNKNFSYINTFISNISSSISPPKTNVRITGGLLSNTSTVYFGDISTPFVIESATSINASVPSSSGNVSISLYDSYNYYTYYSKNFTYQTMVIDNISPLNQVKNGTIVLSGQELLLVQSVKVGSSEATFRTLSNYQLLIKIPTPSGNHKITLTDAYGNTVTSSQDVITKVPTVTGRDKNSGHIGDTLTLYGTDLSYINYVTFGSEIVKNTVITDTQSACTLPYGLNTVPVVLTDRYMNTINASTFTYLLDTPEPALVLAYTPTFTIFDGADVYSSSGTKVTKNNALLYEDTVTVSGIAVEGNMLYICEPSIYKIAKYSMSTQSKLSIQLPSTAQPNVVKVYNNILYVICNANTSTTNPDYLYIFDLANNTVQSKALPIAYTFQGFVKGQTKVSNVLTDCLYYSAITRNNPSQGRICLADMTGTITNEQFMTGISNPLDLLYLNGNLYIDGSTVMLVNVDSPSNALASYQSNASSQYNTVYYGSNASGNVIYMINSTTGIVETISAPSVLSPSILANTISPSSGGHYTRVEITGQNFLASDYTPQIKNVLFQSVAATNLTIVSTTLLYCDAPAGVGNASIQLVDMSDNPIETSLNFLYQTPVIQDVYPRESVPNDNMYIFGKNMNLVTSVLIGTLSANFEILRNDYVRVEIPNGTGTNQTITLIDTYNNIVSNPAFTFNYVVFNATICFPAGTLVQTDQGDVAIELLVPRVHTLNGKDILAITDTYSMDPDLVCIEKDAFDINCPRIQTYISPRHKVFYDGKMTAAFRLAGIQGVSLVPYQKDKLYNVLLHEYGKMNVQGLICETLDPSNPVAKIYIEREMLRQEMNKLAESKN